MKTTTQQLTKWYHLIGIATLAVSSMACQAVMSAELKTTKAADVRLVGDIKEIKGDVHATVNAKLETLDSEVAIEFNQGESLTATADVAAGINAAISLTYDWLELDRFYSAAVGSAQVNGNYYLHYTDQSGSKTDVTIPNGYVAAIITPTANAVLAANTALLTWDPLQMPSSGSISALVEYSTGSGFGFRRFDALENSGSYTLDLASVSGNGTIELQHVATYTNLPGYAESDVKMRNATSVACQFSNAPSNGKSLQIPAADAIEAAVHECLHACAPNETAWLQFDDQRISCCLE